MITTAFVKIWGEIVGAVAWDEANGLASFEYDAKFIKQNIDLSPIKMSIVSGSRIFSFPELRQQRNSDFDTFKGLPGLLADVLPDRYGCQLINSWLVQNGRLPNSMNPVEQLCFIGTRGMGALEFEPSQLKSSKQTVSVELDSLVRVASQMLDRKKLFEAQLDKEQQKAMLDILRIGTSAGGARPKAVIAYNEKTGEVKSGQAKAPQGFEHWLLKLDGVSDAQFGESQGYGRVEMTYYEMAIACGIEMMESRLLEENGRAHFMTKRFDRGGNDVKFHIQTFCALQHFDYNEVNSFSYEQLFQTMRKLRLSYPEAEQMFRRMVFNVLAKNCDDHTKNFSFILKKGGQWELAPAYDVCYAYSSTSIWVSQHALSINGKRKDFLKSDLLRLAESINVKKADRIISEIMSVVSNWNFFADKAGVEDRIKNTISSVLEENLTHF
jgi:serine/threonine-protein kinase HipA